MQFITIRLCDAVLVIKVYHQGLTVCSPLDPCGDMSAALNGCWPPLHCALLTSTPPEFQVWMRTIETAQPDSTAQHGNLTPMGCGPALLDLGGRPATSTCAQPDDLTI